MKKIRFFLVLWGIINLGLFFVSGLGVIKRSLTTMKMSTSSSLESIEHNCIDFEKLTPRQKQIYDMQKTNILRNQTYLWRSANGFLAGGYLAIATLLNTLLCFAGAIFFPHIMCKIFEQSG